eukprot:CAMPEP_0176291364 /NCGR_PEP_ID=MMETSP0121_2-20121125/55507_1 /TAXON_ID=160619 /ORGANISM="Kryptoperidinium foliaceum, Strain CCMP 1326" /LENGTH=73 /DNA_ID=CAMNT_0017632197 /DNA_START=179 /DNA_END=396 /DNA_ORIENTATION=+
MVETAGQPALVNSEAGASQRSRANLSSSNPCNKPASWRMADVLGAPLPNSRGNVLRLRAASSPAAPPGPGPAA